MIPTAHSIRLANGVTLNYAAQGPEDGPAVILLHGFPDSWRSYAPVMRHLPPEFRVVAPSLRGFGESDKPAEGYHPRDLAADIAELMDRLGIDAACVAGHSMGSYVAACLALDHPGRVAGLFLIGTFPCLAGRADMAEMIELLDGMEGEVDAALIRDFQRGTLAQPVSETFFAGIVAESAKVPLHVWRAALRSLMACDLGGELRQIRIPASIIWGDQDGFSTMAEQRAIARAVPRADLVVWRGAGHSLQWEEPQRFAEYLTARIRALTPSRRRIEGVALRRPLTIPPRG